VEKDFKACAMNREDDMDRSRWRKQIGMIDDHAECEWVNVYLVPAHPGCPRQNPKSHKTVVCVCVTYKSQCLYVFQSHIFAT